MGGAGTVFTGLVEKVKEVTAVSPLSGGALRLSVVMPEGWDEVSPGDSILVDGICLTVSEAGPDALTFDAVRETAGRTTAMSWKPGRRVNLERALRLGDRLGGHILSGHVDGVGRIASVTSTGAGTEVAVSLDESLMKYVALKGSVAVNGVSLTVSGLEETAFQAALIPETLERTNLDSLKSGEEVNIEVDVLARYIERLMSGGKSAGLSFDTLARHGFA